MSQLTLTSGVWFRLTQHPTCTATSLRQIPRNLRIIRMQGQSPKSNVHSGPSVSTVRQTNTTGTKSNKKPTLTHFLSLPIGHHDALRQKWSQVSASLLASSPAIPGLHESIILKPGSLHLTLGVLSLASPSEQQFQTSEEASVIQDALNRTELGPIDVLSSSEAPVGHRHTIEDALNLLQSLRPPLANILSNNAPLMVPLNYMDVMRTRPNQKLHQSHVMWAGPDLESEEGKRLSRVCEQIHESFKSAGILQDHRPLKLHCTLINTVYRKGGEGKKRTPFSFKDIIMSPALRATAKGKGRVSVPTNGQPVRIDLGSWSVDELQICEMGSQDKDGVYKSVGAISLKDL